MVMRVRQLDDDALMMYELWDVEIGNALARYPNDRDMAMLIRALVSRNGASYADDLDLTVEDPSGAVIEQLAGSSLVEWADTVLNREADSSRAGDLIASKIKAVRTRVREIAASAPKRQGRAPRP